MYFAYEEERDGGRMRERNKKNTWNLIPQLISIVVRQVPKHLHSLVSGIITYKHKYTAIIQCDTNRKLQTFQAVSYWTVLTEKEEKSCEHEWAQYACW